MHFGVHFPKENVQHHIWLCKMFSITFYKAKCSAKSKKTKHSKKQRECVHFTMSNVTNAFDALQNYIFASHFVLRWKNAFVTFCYTKCTHQMHLMLPLHFVYKMLESGKMHFGVHFPKENVQRTFYEVKCSASHFPKENVQHHIFQRKMFSTSNVRKQNVSLFWRSKNIVAKMLFCYNCSKNAVFGVFLLFALRTFYWCKNTFLQSQMYATQSQMLQMHLMLLCFLHSKKQRQCVHFVDAEHFPLENVQHHIFQKKMFSKAKCYKCIWCCPYILLVLNIFLWKMFSITFYKIKCSAQQHLLRSNFTSSKV